jgi:hypothetical protein
MTAGDDNTFPPLLLEAPPRERYEYFRNWRVIHPKLVQAKESLWHALRYAGDHRVIHLFGCTGVGKTTLRLWIEKLLAETLRSEMERDPDCIPVASVVTPAPDQGPFSWRDVYLQTMYALGEPRSLVAKKRPYPLQFISEDKLAMAPTVPRHELRLAMAGCLHQRRVQVLFYDDAQHFQMVTKAQRLQTQMDNLKWTADVTGTQIVLVGTYDLLHLIDLSGQLARRSASIHFARYHAESRDEFKQFASVVYAFQRHLPLPDESDLVSRCDYLYEHCLGCIGLLKDWLVRALGQTLDANEKRLTETRLEACTDVRKLVAVAKEAIAGEQRLAAIDELSAEWRGLLKSAAHLPTPRTQPTSRVATKKAPRKPGERTAKRDPVGVRVPETVA